MGSNRLQPSCKNKIIGSIYIIHIIHIIHTIRIMHIITIFRIVVCLHRRHKCTVEGLGPSVCFSRNWEQEQYSSIPNCFRRHNKSSIIDSRRPNHDRIHSVTAVKRFCRKGAAVYLLHTRIFGVSQHQLIVHSEMTLVSGWILQLQCLKKGCYLKK